MSNDPNNEDANYFFNQVNEFHKAFNHPYSTTPTVMDAETVLKRMSWDLEETIELLHASSNSLQQFTKLYDQLAINGFESFLKLLNTPFPENKIVAQADALGDKLYYNQGDFNIIGVKPRGVFNAIQKSNMGKLWEDGKPRFRESDGKIIKPISWSDPHEEISEEIERQLAN